MKMSPPWVISSVSHAESGISVKDRNVSFERFVELHFGPSEAEALRLGRDLEMASLPLHNIVVADVAFMMKAADAIQIFWGGAPGFFRIARGATEAAVVVGQEAAQDLIGGVQIVGTGQTQFACEAILKSAPETFDATLGLRTLGCDVSDAELLQSAAELCGLAAAGELFWQRPVIIVANEDAVTIPIEAERYAEAAQEALQQAEIAARVFAKEKFSGENFARGIVQKAQQRELWAATFQPVVKTSVQQQHLALASTRHAALAMRGSPPLPGRGDPGRAQQTAKSFPPQQEAFLLDQFFAEVMVIETGIGGASQMQDALSQALRQATMAGSSAAGVCQSRLTALP